MSALLDRIIDGLVCDQTAGRYAAAQQRVSDFPQFSREISELMDTLSCLDVLETGDPELVTAATQYRLTHRLAHDEAAEIAAIERDGIRGYLQDNGLLTVVHPSAKNPGWWQATVYNTKLCTINGDTQHRSVSDVFGVLGAGISARARPLPPVEVGPILNQFTEAV